MIQVKVIIINRDRKIGAMVKALAVEISGYKAVRGATKEFLKENGFFLFSFPEKEKAESFCDDINCYLPEVTEIESIKVE